MSVQIAVSICHNEEGEAPPQSYWALEEGGTIKSSV